MLQRLCKSAAATVGPAFQGQRQLRIAAATRADNADGWPRSQVVPQRQAGEEDRAESRWGRKKHEGGGGGGSIPKHKRKENGPGVTAVSYKGKHVKMVTPRANGQALAKRLGSGHPACVAPRTHYPAVLKLHSKVKNRLGERSAISSFEEHKAYNAKVRETLQWLLLPLRAPNDPRGPGLDLEKVAAPAVPVAWLPKRHQESDEAGAGGSGNNDGQQQKKKSKKVDKSAGHFISIREWFGLQSAARWWSSGVQYRQLDHKIHPHPGCYFAVPTSRWVCFHFEVFEQWLATTAGLKDVHKAVEVGVGCGVLSFMMLKHAQGPLHITAADVNPSAVMTVNDNAARLGLGSSSSSSSSEKQKETGVVAELSNLVPARFKEELDLVVFNPPWFPVDKDDECNESKDRDGSGGNARSGGSGGGTAGRLAAAAAAAAKDSYGGDDANLLLDLHSSSSSNGEWLNEASPYLRAVLDGEHWLEAASYRDESLMEQFFDSSHRALKVGGRVVIIYCNYAQLVGSEEAPGPVPAELEQSDRFVLQDLLKLPVPLSKKVKQGNEAEWKSELLKKLEIEVWVLEKKH